MAETLKIRFVGGPYHNELRLVDRLEAVAYLGEVESESFEPLPAIMRFYRLCHFQTEFGTFFMQYVDESILGGDDFPTTSTEKFPEWPEGEQVWDKILSAVRNPCQKST
jgi:hypothetical protein